ncbi:MAG: LON peptidase substrate-binding domain-containing protein, partial [Pseudomonadota bacterium]
MTDKNIFPVLPLRDIVVFPNMIVPLFVGREKSVKALENVIENDRKILLVSQMDPNDDDPNPDTIYQVGVVATIIQLLKLPDGTVKVLVEGEWRAQIDEYTHTDEYFEAAVTEIEQDQGTEEEVNALVRSVGTQFESYVKLNKRVPPEVIVSINQIEEPAKLADTVASHLNIKLSEKQELLEIHAVPQRLERVYAFMEGEMSVLQVEKKIRNRVKRQMEKTQREYYLNEQMKAIQKELGETEDGK